MAMEYSSVANYLYLQIFLNFQLKVHVWDQNR